MPQPGPPGRWCRFLACDLHAGGLDRHGLVGDLVARRPADRSPRRDGGGARPTGRLAALAPRDWFAALEPDRPISRYGYARCPLHDEQIPSLKLYERPEDGWYCWGCGRGGDLIEYAAWRLHGRPARGLDREQFRALETWLQARLGGRGEAAA